MKRKLIGAKFSEPKKIICPKCDGTGRKELTNGTDSD